MQRPRSQTTKSSEPSAVNSSQHLHADAHCLIKLSSYIKNRGFPGVADNGGAEVQDAQDEVAEAEQKADDEEDPFAVVARKEALHSLSGSPCVCEICRAAKQRRDRAEVGSHPHGQERFQHEPGLHSYEDSPTYYDTVDYGTEASFTGGCRYDLFSSNPATRLLAVHADRG